MRLSDNLKNRMIRWLNSGRPGSGYGGSLTQGGIANQNTGMGTSSDHTESSFFTPTRFYSRLPLEILYAQSWAARKFVNIPVDDMFIRWRKFMDGDIDGSADTMNAGEKRHDLTGRLRQAMRSARAFGTSLMVLMTEEAPMDTPLKIERIRPGDLKSIRVFDRYDASGWQWDTDIFSNNYRFPLIYSLHPTGGNGELTKVHHSRILRFDGIEPLTDSGFYSYEKDWGLSEFLPIITTLFQDATFASAVSHMAQEASIPVLKISNLRELLSSRPPKNEPSVSDIGSTLNRIKSVFRMLMLDKEEEDFTRVSIQFGGLANLIDRFHLRLAAAADIPATRFLGQSPVGMNATGDSDMRNYVLMVESNRENQLARALPIADEIIARDSGLKMAPEYEWMSLMEMSDKEQAQAAKIKVEALRIALMDNTIDEDEYRRQIDGDPIFGSLPGEAPEPIEIDDPLMQ